MTLTCWIKDDEIDFNLERYKKAIPKTWTLSHKIEMYQLGRGAFSGPPEDWNVEGFRRLFWNLKRTGKDGWNVGRRGKLLAANEILELLKKHFESYSRFNTPILKRNKNLLEASLKTLENVKEMESYPTMVVSKILHFFNPDLFPIWDNAFVNESLIPEGGWGPYCAKMGYPYRIKTDINNPKKVTLYSNYIDFFSDTIASCWSEQNQNRFYDWCSKEVAAEAKESKNLISQDVSLLCNKSTFFEFNLIGKYYRS